MPLILHSHRHTPVPAGAFAKGAATGVAIGWWYQLLHRLTAPKQKIVRAPGQWPFPPMPHTFIRSGVTVAVFIAGAKLAQEAYGYMREQKLREVEALASSEGCVAK